MVLVIKVITKMEIKMVKELITGLQEVVIMENYKMVYYKVLDNIYRHRILVIRESGKITKKMDMVKKSHKMAKYISASTKVILKMVMEF